MNNWYGTTRFAFIPMTKPNEQQEFPLLRARIGERQFARVCRNRRQLVAAPSLLKHPSDDLGILIYQGFSMFANKGWLTKEDGGGLDKPVLGVR